ncbi:MAG: hypothetical protein M1818_003348 [Claussenomyces sp. TS43310]|nr:MAG: hypothetical protein M1818_003348 [Claussenomyces sp. TS43310]
MSESEDLLLPAAEDELGDGSMPAKHGRRCSTLATKPWVLLCIIVVSCAANIIQAGFIGLRHETSSHACESQCTLSHAAVDAPVAVPSEFGSPSNLTRTDAVWEALDTSRGFVALDKGQRNVPLSDPFPWDLSKAVYQLNGFHSLHCLVRVTLVLMTFSTDRTPWGKGLTRKQRVIYISIRQLQRNETQRYDFAHVLHCLDSLRADVTCAADDTPLSIGSQAQEDLKMVQTRRCRDWTQLEDWAAENSACFQGREPGEPGYQTIEEWRHCPERSPYRSVVEDYFSESAST